MRGLLRLSCIGGWKVSAGVIAQRLSRDIRKAAKDLQRERRFIDKAKNCQLSQGTHLKVDIWNLQLQARVKN